MKKLLNQKAAPLIRTQVRLAHFTQVGQVPNLEEKSLVGRHFIHKTLGYRGVILCSFESQRHNHFHPLEDLKQTLVLVDEIDATSKYPNLTLASLKHRYLAGGLNCFDIVQEKDLVFYDNPTESITNITLENFFYPFQIFPNQTLLSPKNSLSLLSPKSGRHSRILESKIESPDQNVNITCSITAYCLAENVTGTSNWVVTVHLEDSETTFEFVKIELSVTEEKENKHNFKLANNHGSDCHYIHWGRTIKLKHSTSLAFVKAKIVFKKAGFDELMSISSPTAVLVGNILNADNPNLPQLPQDS